MLTKLYKRWFFDINENLLKNKKEINHRYTEKFIEIILVQTPADHYYLSLFSLLIVNLKKDKKNILIAGVYPNTFSIKSKSNNFFFYQLFLHLDHILIKYKWKRLYKKIGIDFFIKTNKISLLKKIEYFSRSLIILKRLKSKSEVLNYKLKNITIGDLVYDTYMRYEVRPTLDISDFALTKYFYKSFCLYHTFNNLSSYYKIKEYYSSYSTYIQHGIAVRLFLNKSIPVFTSGNLQQKFKQLSLNDHFHTTNHLVYMTLFNKMIDKEYAINRGLNLLQNKFSGNIDKSSSYMNSSAYKPQLCNKINLENIDGVMFLHDFFDSPHIYDGMLFNDFYEWTIFTLDLIKENNLKIAIKPHPNQVKESIEVINNLKKQYSNLFWIESSVSNLSILNSNIKFGISLYGTVLHELAYFGKFAISAGNNPHYAFDFICKPKDIFEYKNLILNQFETSNIVDQKKDVAIFYYMHNVYKKEDLKYDFKDLENYNVFNTDSSIIPKLINKWL
jgi:hypothetical protein